MTEQPNRGIRSVAGQRSFTVLRRLLRIGGDRAFAVVLLLLTWSLRLGWLAAVPPGWRDDELINIHALSGEVLAGRFPLYFTGASGHEPLYHYLHAGVHAGLGFNPLSGHLPSVVFGTLSIALAYTLARRLFGRLVAATSSLALACSFWSLMYSRTGIRHISLPPFALLTFYLLWRSLARRSQFPNLQSRTGGSSSAVHHLLLGLVMGLSLYTYPAARLLPGLLTLFAVYLALFHRDQFVRHWRGLLLALVVTAILAVPLWAAIVQGRSEASALGIGADARLDELAVPLRELQAGNPRPLLESIWTTLGMFHATGDSEWLYNISGRPVFSLPGGVLLWAGVVLCLVRWRQPRYFFLLLWLGLGLLPAFVSVPPASLSHTILAQPVAYILPVLALVEAGRWCKSRIPIPTSTAYRITFAVLVVLLLTANAIRDLGDYFVVWPQRGMVRFLYRADYREAADYLNAHPEIADLAISSALIGPWDRLALEVDTRRETVAVRLFDPERALVWVEEDVPSLVLLTPSLPPASPINALLESHADWRESGPSHLTLYTLDPSPVSNAGEPLARFANGLVLVETHWADQEPLGPDQEGVLLTSWLVGAQLDLPPIPIVANPPPPGVYSGPRLAVFAHLLAADGTPLAGDDGLWVDPLTLQPGDRFVQVHRFVMPPDAPPGAYLLQLGLYDPMSGDRWPVLGEGGQAGPDRVVISVGGGA